MEKKGYCRKCLQRINKLCGQTQKEMDVHITSKFLTRITGNQSHTCQTGQLEGGVRFSEEAAENQASSKGRWRDWKCRARREGGWESWRRSLGAVTEANTGEKTTGK